MDLNSRNRLILKKDDEITICLLGAGFTTGNMGVAALASGTIAAIYNSFPNAKIYIVDFSREPAEYKVPHPAGESIVKLVNLRFTKKILLQNSIVRLLVISLFALCIPGKNKRVRFLKRNPFLKNIIDATWVVSMAGGDSFSDIYGFRRLLYITLPQLLTMLLRRPLIQLPQTYGPFNMGISKIIAKFVLNRSHQIYARDQESLLLVQDLTRGKARHPGNISFDMGFSLPPVPPVDEIMRYLNGLKTKGKLIGLNVSGLLYMGGYTKQNMFGLKSDYITVIHQLIKYFMNQDGVHLLLIPHVYGKGEKSEGDSIAIEKLYNEFNQEFNGRLHRFEISFNHHQLKGIIGQCDFFLGSRMHACIAAISQNVPTIGLAYSRKFIGVFQTIDESLPVADLRLLECDQIIKIIDQHFLNRQILQEKLQATMPAVIQSVLNFFEKVVR
ncbi:hypothetical protein FCL47_23365 [Desulfopila sp. IMCC35006]|uniref:polysaccharide pyruvyl transferase family protein n=1 Tax=Desulfopila sp. IMCC35006 TaxID=2569542 RepID=UPI0010ABE043|nr:polysaccharide pyruvyl transferase family protein [Desulfopila sp. IMCC35006]TKB23217.1 hypothetical protein FCL47_23365 [Desulfopila sp. IMCC35006]